MMDDFDREVCADLERCLFKNDLEGWKVEKREIQDPGMALKMVNKEKLSYNMNTLKATVTIEFGHI